MCDALLYGSDAGSEVHKFTGLPVTSSTTIEVQHEGKRSNEHSMQFGYSHILGIRQTVCRATCLMTLPSRFDMSKSQNQFLRLLGQLPARLMAEQTAWVLNCQARDVPVLVAARLLKPLEHFNK
jgi:hypothetical protein